MGFPRFSPALFALLATACMAVTPAATVPPTPTDSPASSATPTPSVAPVASATAAAVATATASVAPAAVPRAVIIVGPTDDETPTNLDQGEAMAAMAQAAGMQVIRVFHPHATWDNVLAAIEGASLVAYYGHGYGWPSNTPEIWEVQQDGMGLNAYDGSGVGEVHYYGANKIRQSIRLAPHAVVFLMRGCYTAGNGLNTAPIPTLDVARQHVDNYASGWLAVGAGAVVALAFGTHFDYSARLMDATSEATIDELFALPGDYVGLNELYFDSARTPGARNHLDADPRKGYLRAVSGDLAMTTGIWRSGAGQTTVMASSL